MKLEEVLPHLRAGGEVTITDNKTYTLEELYTRYSSSALLLSDQFEIVKKPYKKELIVKFNEFGHIDEYVDHFFPTELYNKKYKVTIEEIEEWKLLI